MSLDHVNSSSRPGRILWSVVSRSMFDPSSVIWDGWLMTMAEAVQKAKDLAMRDSSAVQAGVLAGGLEFVPAPCCRNGEHVPAPRWPFHADGARRFHCGLAEDDGGVWRLRLRVEALERKARKS